MRPPRPLRGPFTRWPRASDAVLALLTFCVTVSTALTVDVDPSTSIASRVADLPILAWCLLAISAGALYWRRRRPIVVLGTVVLVVVLWEILTYTASIDPAIVVAPYSVGRYVRADPYRYTAASLTMAVLVLGGTLVGDAPDLALALSAGWLFWYVGRRVRMRGEYLELLQDRAEHLERERHAEAERAIAEERANIARELHDVVAHRVSMMTVQAGAAKTVARVDPDGAVEAMAEVEHAGRQALGELRHLLGVLRPDAGERDLGPQPDVGDIPDLVAEHAAAGMDVSLRTEGEARLLRGPVQLYAFRIVQESLTNVFKHAGRHAHTDVRVGVEPDVLTIEVTDTGVGGKVPVASGYGIVGMRERAQLLGGTLDAGPGRHGGFRVRARLPTGEELR